MRAGAPVASLERLGTDQHVGTFTHQGLPPQSGAPVNGPAEIQFTPWEADGVALAAIQGLNQKLERENAALKALLGATDNEYPPSETGVGTGAHSSARHGVSANKWRDFSRPRDCLTNGMERVGEGNRAAN